jgi:hypothetical protein
MGESGMSRLNELRTRLLKLHRLRRGARLGTAWCAVVVAVLWSLAALFLIDWTLEMTRLQRAIALVAAAGAVYWAYRRYSAPLLHEGESLLDVALLVERQQHIDSDLVAALQFETTDARRWGSPQLEEAVIEYVADFSSGLNVFEGFNRQQMVRRGTIAAVTALVLLLAALVFPAHALTFFNRLFMSSAHYPTRTIISKVWINGQEVTLVPGEEAIVRCAYGLPLAIEVEAAGQLPASGVASLWTQGGLNTEVVLERTDGLLPRGSVAPASSASTARAKTEKTSTEGEQKTSSRMLKAPLTVALGAPVVAAEVSEAASTETAPPEADKTDLMEEETVAAEGATAPVKFAGSLPRLVDSLQYQLYLGDAWTEPALVKVIPLPTVEFTLTPTPPKYAARAEATAVASSARQFAVIEGSRVDLEITSDKPLAEARVLIEDRPFELRRMPGEQADKLDHWQLRTKGTPLETVLGPLAYKIETKDEDGLRPSQPIQGFIRLRADRPPRIFATIGTRNVRAAARQQIIYNATDDFGVGAIWLHVQVAKKRNVDSSDDPAERVLEIRQPGKPLPRIEDTYILNLSEFKLEKGDQVTATLEAVDFRGQNEGRSAQSEPLVMYVTDESGVLADLTELDERAARQFESIIKLGIGDKP